MPVANPNTVDTTLVRTLKMGGLLLLAFMTVPFWAPIIIILCLFFGPIIAVWKVQGYVQKHRFWREARKNGTEIDWPTARDQAARGEATIVLLVWFNDVKTQNGCLLPASPTEVDP